MFLPSPARRQADQQVIEHDVSTLRCIKQGQPMNGATAPWEHEIRVANLLTRVTLICVSFAIGASVNTSGIRGNTVKTALEQARRSAAVVLNFNELYTFRFDPHHVRARPLCCIARADTADVPAAPSRWIVRDFSIALSSHLLPLHLAACMLLCAYTFVLSATRRCSGSR
jgi:hypothetical protein